MTIEEFDAAYRFYGMTAKRYHDRLAETLAEINANEAYKAGFELARSRIFSDDSAVLAKEWSYPTREAFFGCEMPPYSTNLLIYSGWERHRAAMEKLKMDDWQIDFQKKAVTWQTDGHDFDDLSLGDADHMGIIFACQFANAKILQIGRLQFEFMNIDGKMPVNTVCVHIPALGPLTPDAVSDAFARAVPILKDRYGVDTLSFECHSWLLSPELTPCLREGSNILAFQRLFDSTPAGVCTDEVLGYVYHVKPPVDYAALPEKTSLQRAVKAALLSRTDFHVGRGVYKYN